MENHKKLAHLLDVTQCVGCSACIVACAQTNYPDMLNAENTGWESLPANIRRVSAELARRPVELLVQCQQCENAPCITVCPFGATSHDPETGQVKTDPSHRPVHSAISTILQALFLSVCSTVAPNG